MHSQLQFMIEITYESICRRLLNSYKSITLFFQEPAQQDRLARLKHRLDQQQSKLNRLRLLRSQTDQSRANNATLSKYIQMNELYLDSMPNYV